MSGATAGAGDAGSGSDVVLRLGGRAFRGWTSVEITRDLTEIAGSFTFEYNDRARARRGLPVMEVSEAEEIAIRAGMEVRVEVDGELRLLGWVDEQESDVGDTVLSCRVTGRDRTGDLVDCGANPQGPAEYRGLKLDAIARALCAPFGISVRAEVDVGEPFPRFSLDVTETVMHALSKAAKQRELLILSDGVGGIVITRSGSSRGPVPLRMPGNVHKVKGGQDWKKRFSDYWVKGQAEKGGGHRRGAARVSRTVEPLPGDAGMPPGDGSGTATAATAGRTSRRGVIMTGHALDPEVTRHRPHIEHPKTQSGGFTAQQLADWRMRTSRGLSEAAAVTLVGWRHGPERRLWRPNEVTAAEIPFLDLDHDVIVSVVTLRKDEKGEVTEMKVTGPEAFEPEREGDRRRRRRGRQRRSRTGGAGDVQSLPGDG